MRKFRGWASVILLVVLFPLSSGDLVSIAHLAQQTGLPSELSIIGRDNASQLKVMAQIKQAKIYQQVWTPDGKMLLIATSTGIWIYDIDRLNLASRQIVSGDAATFSSPALQLSTDGSILATVTDHNTTLWQLPSAVELAQFKGSAFMALSPDGRFLAFITGAKQVHLWDVKQNKEFAIVNAPANPLNDQESWIGKLTFSPAGTYLAASNHEGSEIYIWRTATAKVATTIQLTENSPSEIAFSPDETIMAFSAGHSVQFDNVESKKVTTPLDCCGTDINHLVFSPDGQWVVSGSDDGGGLAVWNAKSGNSTTTVADSTGTVQPTSVGPVLEQPILCPDAYNTATSYIAFSPNGEILVSGLSQCLWVWNMKSGKRLTTLLPTVGTFEYDAVAFNPMGTILSTIETPDTIDLWGIIGR